MRLKKTSEVTQGAAEHVLARRTSIDPLAEEALAVRGLPVANRAHEFWVAAVARRPFPLHAEELLCAMTAGESGQGESL